MRVFLSYSNADKKLAARLRQSLEEEGLSFNDPDENAPLCTSWRQQMEKAIRSSDAVLLLLSSRKKVDELQQLTWRLALGAVWSDPVKRLIPILLQKAELPAFVRSGASGDTVQAIRIREPKDLGSAVQAILRTLYVPTRKPDSFTRFVLEIIENFPAVTDEDRAQRRERLSAIKMYAEQLK